MIRVLKILEIAWLGIAIFSLGMAAYLINSEGFDQAKWFLLGTVVAGAFYAWRRRTRQMLEREEVEKEQNRG